MIACLLKLDTESSRRKQIDIELRILKEQIMKRLTSRS